MSTGQATVSGAQAATELGSWSSSDVTAGEVMDALSSLRRKDRRAAVRASVLTLVVVVADQEEADNALSVVHALGTRHPSRTIVLVVGHHEVRGPGGAPGPGRRGRVSGRDAVVNVYALEEDGRSVCFEDLVITIRGQGRHHLDSVVEPFTLPDVRMVVWLPSRLPFLGDPLMAAANMVVVDSRAAPADDGEILRTTAQLARRIPVADLSWIRLASWRHLLAGLFEGALARPFLSGVTRARVAGKPGPRHLLGGWLLRRLELEESRLELEPAEHVSMAVDAVVDGRRGRFEVRRPGADRILVTTVDIEDGPSVEQVVTMPRQWPSLALAGALTQPGHDGGYEQAVAGALQLLRRRPA